MIETVGLTKRFVDFEAVSDVSLAVQSGQVLALLGPNGAGKTTTVRMLASILSPSSGTARVAGHDIVCEPDAVRAAVGVLTEHHGLYLRMRASEYLDFYGQLYNLPPEVRQRRAARLVERFGLGGDYERRVGTFSKGMRQKLALARAMLHNPSVLLLDEPTSAMDPHSARLVRDAIADLRGDGRTIMICTHNLPEAEMLADRIAFIRRGRIVDQGTSLELKSRLLGPPLLELRVAGELNGLLDILSGMVEVDSHGYDWVRYRVENPTHDNPLVLKRLGEQGVGVVTLSEVTQSLEDVYLRVVEGATGEELA